LYDPPSLLDRTPRRGVRPRPAAGEAPAGVGPGEALEAEDFDKLMIADNRVEGWCRLSRLRLTLTYRRPD